MNAQKKTQMMLHNHFKTRIYFIWASLCINQAENSALSSLSSMKFFFLLSDDDGRKPATVIISILYTRR